MLKHIPKPLLFTLVYYAVATLLSFYFRTSNDFKSGPCNPGLDLLWPVLMFLVAIILLSVFMMRWVLKKQRSNLYVALIHLLALVIIIIWFVV